MRIQRAPLLYYVAIVGFSPPALDAQDVPERVAREAWRLGGVDAPDYWVFSREPELAVDLSGKLFLRSSDPPGVAVFNDEGAYLRWIGGRGEGPGEFQMTSAHGLVADTLWITNWPTPRVSKFLSDGTHISTTQLDPIDFGHPLSSPQSVSSLLQGNHALAIPSGTPVGGEGRVPLPVLFGDLELQARRSIIEVPVPREMMIPGVGSFAFAPIPIPPLVVADANGRGFAVVEWEDDGSGSVVLSLHASSGERLWSRTITLGTSRLPDAVRDEWVARGVEMARPHVEGARNEGRISGSVESLVHGALSLPTWMPPVERVFIGADGSIWLGHMALGDEREWLVLDPAGAPVFTVTLPSSVMLRAAVGGSVWGTEIGAFDVPLVARFELL